MTPPRLDLPAGDYVVGKKWTYRSIQTNKNGSKGWVEGEVRIVALEDVTVPAGTFKAYKLELNSISQRGERVQLIRWHQSDWGVAIKTLREIRRRSGGTELEIYELLSFKRGAA